MTHLTRRDFNARAVATIGAALASPLLAAAADDDFRLRYIVASAMYGHLPLAEILPEVTKCGASHIELWAKKHGSQREQVDELGVDRVKEMFDEHGVQLGSLTCFKYGIFKMQGEMKLVQQLGGDMVICNTPKPAQGDDLKTAVRKFARQMQPHVEFAEDLGITIGVENHVGGVINERDSIRWLMDEIDSPHLGLAMAPYHLPQNAEIIASLIRDLDERLVHFQAWEHGDGCMQKLPKEQELKQLPHRGPLDFVPLVAALQEIGYRGRTEVFMHPVPRGVPILPTIDEVTAEINRGRAYLDACIDKA